MSPKTKTYKDHLFFIFIKIIKGSSLTIRQVPKLNSIKKNNSEVKPLKLCTFWLELELTVDEECEEYDDECEDDDDEYDDTVVGAPMAAGGGALGMAGICAEGGKLGGGP